MHLKINLLFRGLVKLLLSRTMSTFSKYEHPRVFSFKGNKHIYVCFYTSYLQCRASQTAIIDQYLYIDDRTFTKSGTE